MHQSVAEGLRFHHGQWQFNFSQQHGSSAASLLPIMLDKKVIIEKIGIEHQRGDCLAKPRLAAMNAKFMMEFTNSRKKLREFPLRLSRFKRDRRSNLHVDPEDLEGYELDYQTQN